MPRKKQTEQSPANALPPIPENATVADLVKMHGEFLAFVESETARFSDYMKPYNARLDEIKNVLLARSNQEKWDSQRTEFGTAYRTTTTSPSIDPDGPKYIEPETGRESTGREALIDWALANWQDGGDAMLLVRPQAEAVRDYMQAHEGQCPPGVKITSITKINVKRS